MEAPRLDNSAASSWCLSTAVAESGQESSTCACQGIGEATSALRLVSPSFTQPVPETVLEMSPKYASRKGFDKLYPWTNSTFCFKTRDINREVLKERVGDCNFKIREFVVGQNLFRIRPTLTWNFLPTMIRASLRRTDANSLNCGRRVKMPIARLVAL